MNGERNQEMSERGDLDNWFRVEVTDRNGQVVAIESEMLAGRDIGPTEEAVIVRAIAHLSGFLGLPIHDQLLAHLSRGVREK